MSMCTPETDWSCSFTAEQIAEMRATPAKSAMMDRAEELAWYSLAMLCAYQIGVCPTTVRPCVARGYSGTWFTAIVDGGNAGGLPLRTIGTFTPYVTGGEWVNACACRSVSACGCSNRAEIILPGPIGDIVEVRIDGEILPPTAYRVDNGAILVRQDGGTWPSTQDMAKSMDAPDQKGVFAVTYYRGAAPNPMVQLAAGLLAKEFYDACDTGKCKLPRRATSVSRSGVTMDLEKGMFEDGLTRIPQVDAVIRIYNPHLAKARPRVISPDAPSSRSTTWRMF